MCRPVICKTCFKTTWAGCGRHVAFVRASVAADQWCPGHEKTKQPRRIFEWKRDKGNR
ncbi:MAG: hypothetical protein NVS3B1_29970 [Marmoricola sp.]